MRIHVHHHILLQADDPIVKQIMAALAGVQSRNEVIMIDTSKALAAVQQEITDNASMRTLLAQIHQALLDTQSQLAAAIAANDPAAAAAVQADLDKIAQLANTDDAATQAAISANQAPAAAPPATQAPAAAPAPTSTSPITTDAPGTPTT